MNPALENGIKDIAGICFMKKVEFIAYNFMESASSSLEGCHFSVTG